MSKKRKTLQQKMASSARQAKISLSPTPAIDTPVYSIQTEHSVQTVVKQTVFSSSNDYSYVARDARKTLLVIGFLIGLNVVVFLLLQSNALPIKF